jgi:hypothetical protein
MTQLQHAPRRATMLAPALAAAAFLTAATMTGILVFGQPGGLSFGQATTPKVVDAAGAVESGRIWQTQHEQQSVSGIRLNRAKDAAVLSGTLWQAEREQQSIYGIRLNRAKDAAVLSGQDWEKRHGQTNTIR